MSGYDLAYSYVAVRIVRRDAANTSVTLSLSVLFQSHAGALIVQVAVKNVAAVEEFEIFHHVRYNWISELNVKQCSFKYSNTQQVAACLPSLLSLLFPSFPFSLPPFTSQPAHLLPLSAWGDMVDHLHGIIVEFSSNRSVHRASRKKSTRSFINNTIWGF